MYLEKIDLLTTQKTDNREMLEDYYTAYLSRQLSLMGRREVHNGRAHFGIFGDGKELPQIALAKTFKKGDWRSGYYRDQTFMLALGLLEPEEFFAMIYGDTDVSFNPSTGGRNFNNHYCTRNIDADGKINNLQKKYNSASDISSTGGQMPRLLGLAQASKLVRNNESLAKTLAGNVSGNEVAYGSIGDASTSEGMFFETINAACVMQVPMAVAVYDDGYGISVPIEKQTAKASISKALKGFEKTNTENGCLIVHCHGWDYPNLIKTFDKGIRQCREKHIPVVFHIDQLTQPTGHSTSGSHERYKSKERLEWEKEWDGLNQFKKYLLKENFCTEKEIKQIEKQAKDRVKTARDSAWKNYTSSFKQERDELGKITEALDAKEKTEELIQIDKKVFPTRRAYLSFAKRIFYQMNTAENNPQLANRFKEWISTFQEKSKKFYNEQLYRELHDSALKISSVKAEVLEESPWVNGSEVLNANFDKLFARHPNLVTFGEDTGFLGDVNQGMKGMQTKYSEDRVFDTGIRETTIIGQGIGLALRGFRPIAEIQYLDYLIYALPTLSDDLASMQYRTMGKQAAPVIVRTRGHQLQGIWHAGSPMSMLLGSLKGIYLCVPRNMVQASGMYNTLLEANDPALVIEPLKAYNVKEQLPENIGENKVALGESEVLQEGEDITLVTYGWNVNHALKAADLLSEYNISVEVIDVQTLMPFDLKQEIRKSVMKTGKVIFVDEDVAGGGTAYMMQKSLDDQKIFDYLDTAPVTLPAQDHRPAYGIDGEYFSKPNVELIFESIMKMMHETDLKSYKTMDF